MYSTPATESYSVPTPSYSPPAPAYSPPASSYSPPAPAYNPPATLYSAPAPSYKSPVVAYSAPEPVTYQAPETTTTTTTAPPPPAYEEPRESYNPPSEITSYRPPIQPIAPATSYRTPAAPQPSYRPASAPSYTKQEEPEKEDWPTGPADFKIPEFGSYFNADAFESTSQFVSASSTSYRTPAASDADNDLEFDEPKKIPEIEVYYKPLPQQLEPETTTYKPIEEFTPGPVYYKPLPDAQEPEPVRSFLKKQDNFGSRPEGFFRPRNEGFSRTRSELPSTSRSRPKTESEPKRKPANKPEFFGGFDDRNSDFGDFGGSDIWDKLEQDWGQKVSK